LGYEPIYQSQNTNIKVINPSVSEMIESTLLPDYHKDPFDRILIAQANQNHLLFIPIISFDTTPYAPLDNPLPPFIPLNKGGEGGC
jgi:PIN domain nuclease of toxin-antitoxin system